MSKTLNEGGKELNLLETRKAIDTLYLNKLLSSYAETEREGKNPENSWHILSMCHDYLQIGGSPGEDSPFRDLVNMNPKDLTNNLLDLKQKMTFQEAVVRNQNLTLQEIRKCLSIITKLVIVETFKTDLLVKALLEFVQCGGVLEELEPTLSEYTRKIERIEHSEYSIFLANIRASSRQNAVERLLEKNEVKVQIDDINPIDTSAKDFTLKTELERTKRTMEEQQAMYQLNDKTHSI